MLLKKSLGLVYSLPKFKAKIIGTSVTAGTEIEILSDDDNQNIQKIMLRIQETFVLFVYCPRQQHGYLCHASMPQVAQHVTK